MTLQEIWKIKEEKSQATKNMTTEQLNEYFSASMREFYKLTNKPLSNEQMWQHTA